MQLLILLRELVIGGAQINALNLAESLRRRGHTVLIGADRGPLESVVSSRGLQYAHVPYTSVKHPSATIVRRIAHLVREYRIDLIHNFKSTLPEAIEAYWAGFLTERPVLQSWQGNWVPAHTIHYPRIGKVSVSARYLIDDWVDLGFPRENLVYWGARIRLDELRSPREAAEFLRATGLEEDLLTIVTVNRMDRHQNWQYQAMLILAAGELVERLSGQKFQVVLVGDGDGRPGLEKIGAKGNQQVGWPVVHFPGAMMDPMPAYMAADIFVGRSSSLLRAMALGKPCVVIGNNYSRIVCPETLEEIEYYQYYRHIPSNPVAVRELAVNLEKLAKDKELRDELGRFAREVIQERYDLRLGAQQMEGLYEELRRNGGYPGRVRQLRELIRSLVSLYAHRAKRKLGYKPGPVPTRAGLPFEEEFRVVGHWLPRGEEVH